MKIFIGQINNDYSLPGTFKQWNVSWQASYARVKLNFKITSVFIMFSFIFKKTFSIDSNAVIFF